MQPMIRRLQTALAAASLLFSGSAMAADNREGDGTGRVEVSWPDGGKRVIFFAEGTPESFDANSADGDARMTGRGSPYPTHSEASIRSAPSQENPPERLSAHFRSEPRGGGPGQRVRSYRPNDTPIDHPSNASAVV